MQEEMEIMRRNLSGEIHQEITPVIHQNDILKARESVKKYIWMNASRSIF